MFDHMLKEMAQAVAALNPSVYEEGAIEEALRTYWSDKMCVTLTFGDVDAQVHVIREDDDDIPDLTDEQKRVVLDRVLGRYDMSETLLSWELVNDCIWSVLRDAEEEDA